MELYNIHPDLTWEVPYSELEKELFYYLDAPGRCNLNQTKNKIIKYFQQDNFYAVEKEMWKDDNIKKKIIENRCKYLFKKPEELTTYDILSGFKKSAMYYGYSGFNPLLAKWFYKRYNIKTSYDPCGGWGHRLLGSLDLSRYIYNDLSTSVYEVVREIAYNFDYPCGVYYNRDARGFIPEEDFEAMFTCPPYFNIEHYECGDFKDRKEFDEFIDSLFDVFYSKESCRVFGMVIHENLIGKHTNYDESFFLKKNRAVHLMSGQSAVGEYLYVYKKPVMY